MLSYVVPRMHLLLLASFSLCLSQLILPAHGQQPTLQQQHDSAKRDEPEEVVRISTDLVQTDVMVFDKQGHFVDGLKPEQFELRVDGRPQAITFFERIKAGAVNEDAQLAAARGGSSRSAATPAGSVQPLDRGRTIFFFVDDLHLSPASALRTRKTIVRFIDEEMKQNDEAAVTSTTGQIGFLQQLTGDPIVLRAAAARLSSRAVMVRDFDNTPMSEVQARAIEQNDAQVTDFFIDQLLREVPRLGRDAAMNMVQTRARNLMQQSTAVAVTTLASLENIVRTSASLPGRKVVFFISDGFLLDLQNTSVRDRLRRVTDAAARAGVVIYTMDARGLVTGMPEAGDRVAFDPGGRLASINMGEISAMQEPLQTLAADTGGRALLNTNALNLAFMRALKETSVYYLLAWRPATEEGRVGGGGGGSSAKFRRIEASVKDRPELNVVVRRGFYATPPNTERAGTKEKKAVAPPAKTADSELLEAMKSLYPRTALPTSLSLGYYSVPNLGMVLTASIELEREALSFHSGQDQKSAIAAVAGAVFDDRGRIVSSAKQELTIAPAPPPAEQTQRRRIIYSFQFRLAPGLYQVRVAARDQASGRTGSALQWVEVPDLKQTGLQLSSLFIGERMPSVPAEKGAEKSAAQDSVMQGVMLTADRRFARTSWIRFVTYIYNAAASATAQADIALQVQVFRDDQPVITTPLRKVETAGVQDMTRIPYAAELALASLPVGRYVLQVTAIDRTAKSSASQRINFMIE